ncbi:DUF4271 domain-containing protein [Lacibacter sp. H375]|uniref:DUF4271 domain-containing protein n=1 Tax=Lacibacter sp. H375 TaxID=3133424 RepID=UPI0030C0524B
MRLILFLLLLLVQFTVAAQDTSVAQQRPDSVSVSSPAPIAKDTIRQLQTMPLVSFDSSYKAILAKSRLNLFAKPQFQIEKEKQVENRDWLFYYILGIALLFGLLRISYLRYFSDMFRVFFRTSLRVNQIREQLVQSGLQSLLFNLFFAVAAGTYVYLLISYFDVSVKLPDLFIPLITTVTIALMYLGKYVFLQVSGWLFGMKNAAETYSFIVFLINKIVGVVLLPFLFVIAFAEKELAGIAITISLVVIVGLFLYRFLRAYRPVQAEIKVGRFHFFIFFLAFEIAPLLVIYKLILGFL